MKGVILVIPVYNEEKVLEQSIFKLYKYMSTNIKQPWTIVIANNASIDNTKKIANRLSKKNKFVEVVHLKFKGRGNALKYTWSHYKADVYAYCDVDLATDILHLKELFDSILEGNNVVAGSRYQKTANSKRTISRFILSKGYIYLIKLFFKTNLTDFQCGFKAVDNKIVKEIIPKIRNREWFFDTELLLRAEQAKKYKIREMPVAWKESKDTKVRILKTVYDYIKNLMRLKIKLS
jgi:glycosyltransferase involved in cell wall biosynthesis